MYAIEILMTEHQNILRLTRVIRTACLMAIEGKPINCSDFEKIIAFIRGYADKHHHGKEEQLLFAEMVERLGQVAINLVRHGMLVEHDLGRLYISELEAALGEYRKAGSPDSKLDIVAAAIGYSKLLQRHVEKEDTAVYTFAEKHLPRDVLSSLDAQTMVFEKQAAMTGAQEKYLLLLQQLEDVYGAK